MFTLYILILHEVWPDYGLNKPKHVAPLRSINKQVV